MQGRERTHYVSTWTFWRQTIERALRAGVATALGLLGADGANLLTMNWKALGAAAGLAALVSVGMSIVASGVGPTESPSLVALPAPPAPPAPEYRDV